MQQVYRALADPTRRQILALLRQGEQSAGALADQFAISKPAMSKHFQMLREAGLVYSEKKGQQVIYRLRLSVLEEALSGFMTMMNIGPLDQLSDQTSEQPSNKETQDG